MPARPIRTLLAHELVITVVLAVCTLLDWSRNTPTTETVLLNVGVASLGLLAALCRQGALSLERFALCGLGVVHVTLVTLVAQYPCGMW